MTDKILTLIVFFFQVGLTFFLLFCIYIFLALLDYQGGIDGFVGMTFIQPIIGAVLSSITIFTCFILGLPIRLIKGIKSWLISNFFIAIIGLVLGMTLLLLSLIPHFSETIKVASEDGKETIKQIPNISLGIAGWFITAFSSLHLYPPKRIMDYFKTLIVKFNRTNDGIA